MDGIQHQLRVTNLQKIQDKVLGDYGYGAFGIPFGKKIEDSHLLCCVSHIVSPTVLCFPSCGIIVVPSRLQNYIYNIYHCIYCNTYTYWGSRGLHFQTMPYTWLCLRTENRSRKTHVFEYRDCGVGWGGVGWGGMFLVLRTWYIAMLLRSLGSFTTLHVATLLRSLGSFTTLHVLCEIWWKSQFPATWVPKVTSWWCTLELGNGDAFARMLTASW